MRTDIVEASEFPALAQHYAVYAVPKTVINETQEVMGAVPEGEMVRAVLAAAGDQQPAAGATPHP